jgi:ribonuclease D
VPTPAPRSDITLDEIESELHERLKAWRKRHAASQGIDSSLVLNRKVLLRLARGRPKGREALMATEGLLSWQEEAFRDELLAIVAGFERDLAAGRIRTDRHDR